MSDSSLQISPLYRVLFLWFEPLAAFNGAILAHVYPTYFLRTMHATAIYDSTHQVIFDQLAATYVLFAINEGIVLRLTNDIRIWRTMIAGILCCDLIHLYGSYNALGREVFFTPGLWRPDDWMNLSMLFVPIFLRSLFLLGVGVGVSDLKAKTL